MTIEKKKKGRPKVIKTTEADPNDPLVKDFRNFMYLVWQFLLLPEPTTAQYRMANFIQYGPDRSILAAMRGLGKSYVTVAYCAWRLYCNPQIEIMVVSAGEERAITFAKFLKDLINGMPMLNHLKARDSQRDSVQVFDVGPKTAAGSPSVKSIGITGQLTGSRADLIIADDVESPRNSATHDQREKLAELVKEFAAVLKPNGKILYLGTPQTELSLYTVLETRGYQMRIYPAEYPNPSLAATYGHRLDPDLRRELEEDPTLLGKPTDPKRFDEEELQKKKLEYGRSGFALQFMLDTSLSDGNRMPLKIDDLIVMNCRDEYVTSLLKWSNNPLLKLSNLPNVALAGQSYYANEYLKDAMVTPFQSSVMTIDPSGRGSDEVGFAVVKWASGNFYLVKAGGLKGGYDDSVLIKLAEIARDHKVNKIVIESNWGDGMFSKLFSPHIQRIYPVTLEEVRHSTQKEIRIIDTLEPIMNQHRLVVDPNVIQEDYDTAMRNHPADKARDYMLFYQLSRITKDKGSLKHDDRLDALAMAIKSFTQIVDADQKIMHDKMQEEFFRKELQEMKKAMGVSTSKHINSINRMNKKLRR